MKHDTGLDKQYVSINKQLLPETCQAYLNYQASIRKSIYREKMLLSRLSEFLEHHGLSLSAIRIEHIDAFLAESHSHLSVGTQNSYRSCLRVFFSYLYANGKMRKDFSGFIINRKEFSQPKPAKYLSPAQIKQLFAGLNYENAKDLRAYAMIHLAYMVGLRPWEIGLITLDDISFRQGLLSVRHTKNQQPALLPLPEAVLQAISAYIIGGRPKSESRSLFLSFNPGNTPFKSAHVALEITAYLRKAGIKATAYCLRHTYAQNLLENDVSIFEIKEMMGHANIQTTQHYIRIHVKLMRRTLFNEAV